MRTKRIRSRGKKCCVLDARGKRVACFARPEDARSLQRIIKRSRTSMACDRGMAGAKSR